MKLPKRLGGALLWAAVVPIISSCTTVHGLPEATQEIEFESYRLDNGLNVILHEDHRLPLVSVNLWYYVGGKDEAPGLSGFAHLFEHLMFMGTDTVPRGTFDQIIEGAGGSNNATTSPDRTNYFELAPSNLLETLLYLEADRMRRLGNDMTQKKLDRQREIVRNERRQTYEIRPYGEAFLAIWPNMYPPEHPYHYPVIGSHEDLESATLADVKGFFANYYVPRNASLVIAGDFEPDEARGWVQQYFGDIPAGEVPPRRDVPEVALQKEVVVELEDDVQLARTEFIYHSPALYAPGDAELDIVSYLLGDGKSSRLYRTLVHQKRIAQNVSAVQMSSYLGSIYIIRATALPGVTLEQLEDEIDAVVGSFLEQKPDSEAVQRARNQIETMYWHAIESLDQRADLLNRYQFHFNTPDGIARDLQRYREVTPARVREWAKKVLRPDARLVLRVRPQGAGQREPGPAGESSPEDEN